MRTPKATVWRAYPGEVFQIALVNGEWLWIQEKGGWMWEKDGLMFDDAISEASRRLARNRTAESYHIRGVVFLAHEKHKRALQDFSASLVRAPRNAGVLNNRGHCHYLLKNYPAAIADFTEAIEVDSGHFVAFNNRALAYIATEQYPAARRDVQQALKLNPKYPEALLNRGVIHEKSGQSERAIADYTAALKIHSSYSEAYGNRAFSQRTLGRYDKAIRDLRKAIELAPTSCEPINDLAFVLATAREEKFRDGEKALALAKQACSMSSNRHWNTLDTLAAAHAEVNDFEGAAEAITTALELAPENKQERLLRHQQLIAGREKIRE